MDASTSAANPQTPGTQTSFVPSVNNGGAELPPFHLAFPVNDLAASRHFYGTVLGCPEGRSSPEWIDFNLFGHQIVAHLVPGYQAQRPSNAVDGHDVLFGPQRKRAGVQIIQDLGIAVCQVGRVAMPGAWLKALKIPKIC